MSSLSDNMFLDEEEMIAFCGDLTRATVEINDKVSNYIKILNKIRKLAITNGEVAKALSAYIEAATLLKKQMLAVSQSEKKLVRKFISEVDYDDKYIY